MDKRTCHRGAENGFLLGCECRLYFGGANLRLHRQRVGLSQQGLAEALTAAGGDEVSQQQVSRWEASFRVATDLPGYLALKKVLEI